MKTILLTIYCMISVVCFSQITIEGTIADFEQKSAIPYATIYVNNSTIGTISDQNGNFKLVVPETPFKLVISHIGYTPEFSYFDLQSADSVHLNIELQKTNYKLNEVQVLDKNKREASLNYFKENFFGDDKWGDYSFLKNDSVLSFLSFNHDTLETWHNKPDFFKATAYDPLQVELPIIGYNLHINIRNFTVSYDEQLKQYLTHINGYFYYQAIEQTSNFKANKVRKNRLKAYYNSRQHFIHSLYNNRLLENGYIINKRELTENRIAIKENNQIVQNIPVYDYKAFNLDTCTQDNSSNKAVVGLKGKTLRILYHHDSSNKPKNLTKNQTLENTIISVTDMLISSDSCIILPSGKIINNSIIFGPSMGSKKVGSYLPNDYLPQTKRIRR